jgi:hypothetical protein
MTCRHALSLLDDYADASLDPALSGELKEHLAGCTECRHELDELLRLKEILKTPISGGPSEAYWSEVSALIAAKTIESEPAIRTYITPVRAKSEKRELARSAMAFAASICILFTALYLGSQRNQSSRFNSPQSSILITASLQGVVGDQAESIITTREYASLVGCRFMMGTPGPLGRAIGPLDLLTF